MARSLRIEFPGAIYHVTSRGNARQQIVRDDADRKWLGKWPVAQPRAWVEHVNQVQTEAELEVIRRSVARGQPYGNQSWVSKTAKSLGLGSTLRPRGHPRKDNP